MDESEKGNEHKRGGAARSPGLEPPFAYLELVAQVALQPALPLGARRRELIEPYLGLDLLLLEGFLFEGVLGGLLLGARRVGGGAWEDGEGERRRE